MGSLRSAGKRRGDRRRDGYWSRDAARLVEAGANVVVADLDGEAAATWPGRRPGGDGRWPWPWTWTRGCGPSDGPACVEAFGAIDVLVKNAGIYPMSPMLETTQELFDRVYR